MLSHPSVAALSFLYRCLYLPFLFIVSITPANYFINGSSAPYTHIFFIQATVSNAG